MDNQNTDTAAFAVETPVREELIARARAWAPLLRERAAACETKRQLPRQTIVELKANKLCDITKPAQFGGYVMSWDVFCEVIMEIAKGCASTAWVCAVYGEYNARFAIFGDAALQDVWGTDPTALICSGNSPEARIKPVDGGFIVNGRYGFASGCANTDWHVCASRLEAGGAPHQVLFPAADREIVDDWRVLGLAGTGSSTIEVRELFVPAHRVMAPGAPGPLFYERALFRQPQFSLNAFILASVAIGAAEGALENFTQEMKSRASRFGAKIAEYQSLQLRIAESAAELHAARRVTLHDVRDSIAYLNDHNELARPYMARNKRDFAYVTRLATDAIDRIFYAGGANALFLSADIQRVFRDVHAAASQLILNWDVNGTIYGQMELGVDPGFVRW